MKVSGLALLSACLICCAFVISSSPAAAHQTQDDSEQKISRDEDSYLRRITNHAIRIKRGFFDNLFSVTEEKNQTSQPADLNAEGSAKTSDSLSAQRLTGTGGAADDDDDGEGDDDSDEIDAEDPDPTDEEDTEDGLSTTTPLTTAQSNINAEPSTNNPIDDRCRGDDKYPCANGVTFICSVQKCDGSPDCPGGDDEENCPAIPKECSDDMFQCDINVCLPGKNRCDGRIDCADGKDEENCPENKECDENSFRCTSDERCIPLSKRCDGQVDCIGQEDESDCVAPCQANEFRCSDGQCLNEAQKCNGIPECKNGEDESGCQPKTPEICRSDQFQCRNGLCINRDFVCDGDADCVDNSDEMENCNRTSSKCAFGQFRCNDGQCISNSSVCDFRRDCNDYSDEANCTKCHSSDFQCSNGECVPISRRCDGYVDCADRSDESQCYFTTSIPFTTSRPIIDTTRHSIPSFRQCSWNEFACRSGECIPLISRCNRIVNCYDGSDEDPQECGGSPNELNLQTYPHDQIIKEGREVVFQCRDEGPMRAAVEWSRANGEPLPPLSRQKNGRLEIPNIQMEHGGAYVCRAVDVSKDIPKNEVSVYLRVEPFSLPQVTRPPKTCDLDEATCANGECIPKRLVCDSNPDCSDGSDEMRCSLHGCEPNEFRCANRKCVRKVWLCDGDNDCGDNSDEENCVRSPPGSPCKFSEFQCQDGNQCIPKAFQCDSEVDCIDNSDEVGCSAVFIRKGPPPMSQLSPGETFNISCSTVGVPTPEVVWRLNWGHIPPKCVTTSVNGVGTLSCPDIQEEDQGAYSCEGMNNKGSVFASPDTILVVKPPGGDYCPPGAFNRLAESTNDCISCFCLGVTNNCKGAEMYVTQIPTPFQQFPLVDVYFDPRDASIDITNQPPRSSPLNSRNTDDGRLLCAYFAFPESVLGNQIRSYGGHLKYTVTYNSEGNLINAPDIILAGRGKKLFLRTGRFEANERKEVDVRFMYGYWYKRGVPEGRRSGGDIPSFNTEILATREEIMVVLTSVEHLLIRAQYVESATLDTTVSNVQMDTSTRGNTGQGLAPFVEECRCPIGYEGSSCESCSPGYERDERGSYLGECRPSVLPSCPAGTYGNPRRDVPCQQCACPHTTPSNQFGKTCYLDTDGLPTCNCPPGYIGRRCEQCAPGFTGAPLMPGDYCRSMSSCNEIGSLSVDRYTGECKCKDYVAGERCDECKANSFYLSPDNEQGCIPCFCMGVTEQCSSATSLYRHAIYGDVRNPHYIRIADRRNLEKTYRNFTITRKEVIFNSFPTGADQGVYYWILSRTFLGDMTMSYGGTMNYTIRHVPVPGGRSKNTAPDVEIIGDNNIRLLHYNREPMEHNREVLRSVTLTEKHWQRTDGNPANREHFLMTLANLTALLIKATYTTNTQETAFERIVLETAVEYNTGNRLALEVEQCVCPEGYRGLSCQYCDEGYTRRDSGLYLGTCERCNCNGHSNECDPETGECINCRDNTRGAQCEYCAEGFDGDARYGGGCSQTSIFNNNCSSCDPRGTINGQCIDNRCTCKRNVYGETCDTCISGTFDLQSHHSAGCLSCFCSGVTNNCTSSTLYATQIPLSIMDPHAFVLTDSNRQRVINTGLEVDVGKNQLGYDHTAERRQTLFWSLPPIFTGNKVTSYGGNLTYTIDYTMLQEGRPYHDTDVAIYGNGIYIHWSYGELIQPFEKLTLSVPLSENGNWRRVTQEGTRIASRSDVMSVLSSVEAILVRATYASQMSHTYISDLVMDTAVNYRVSSVRATQVEDCRCPAGYQGHSCHLCGAGYYRPVLQSERMECRKCPCNDKEESCSQLADSSIVCVCRQGYSGNNCEESVTNVPKPTDPPPDPVDQIKNSGDPSIEVIIADPIIQIVSIGSTVRFRCTARSRLRKPIVSIIWSKEGSDQLPPRRVTDDGEGNLVFLQTVPSDSGTYLCSASDGEVVTTTGAVLTVGEPAIPVVRVNPDKSLTVVRGNPVEFHCFASGIPKPSLEWGRSSGQALNDNERSTYPLSQKMILKKGIFRITSVQKSDEGAYYCRATNEIGADIAIVSLTVLEEEPTNRPFVRLRVNPEEGYEGPSGDRVVLECVSDSAGDYRRIWSRRSNSPLPITASDVDGRLVIYNASPVDSDTYICSAVSELTGRTESTVSVPVVVTPSAARPLPLTIQPERQTVAQGTTAEIKCVSPNSASLNIVWSKVNDQLSANAQILGNVLRIPAVQVRDRGVYVCKASNDFGSTQTSAIIEVERREPPVIELYPKMRQSVIEGGSALLQCRLLKGIPQPTIEWTRPDRRPFTNRVEVLSSGVLRFSSVSAEEEGEYVCTATNPAGTTDAIATLDVISFPVITVNPPSPVTVLAGRPLLLQCSATGKPTPMLQWIVNNQRNFFQSLSPKPEREKLTPLSATYEVNSATENDNGTYTCVATNEAGTVEEAVRVSVVSDDIYSPTDDIRAGFPLSSTTEITDGRFQQLDEEVTYPVGSNAQIRCDPGIDDIHMEWVREGGAQLPYQHRITNGALIISNIRQEDAGRYTCVGLDPSGNVLFRKPVSLSVIEPPQIFLQPTRQIVKPGDSAYVTCSARGQEPITLTWTTANNTPLPPSVLVDRGYLQFRSITIRDTGKYLCVATNSGGTAEAVAEVIVTENTRKRPTITAENRTRNALEGSDMQLKCHVDLPTNNYRISWERESGPLPADARTSADSLFLSRLRIEDSDRYICKLNSSYGKSSDYIDLRVDPLQNIKVRIDVEPQTKLKIGETLDLKCVTYGYDGPIAWSKVGSSMDPNVAIFGRTLKINKLKMENAGIYRCLVATSNGEITNEHVLSFKPSVDPNVPQPLTNASVQMKFVEFGYNVDLTCQINMDPPVTYSWIAQTYDKSRRRIVKSDTLPLENVTAADSGMYICSASDGKTHLNMPTAVIVKNALPGFGGNSFLALPPLTDSSTNLEIEISFKPKSNDGLILYNGQHENGGGDFVSFGLRSGIPEFRYDVGSGIAIILAPYPISLDEFHTIRLIRNGKNGIMEVDGVANFTGKSPGTFEKLDICTHSCQPLYLGGLPEWPVYHNSTQMDVGFEGCVSRLVINGLQIDPKKESVDQQDLAECDSCQENPCRNEGFCQQAPTNTGRTCICIPGFSGAYCEQTREECYLDTCGKGICVELKDSIKCLCPFEKTGKRCAKSIKIKIPAFAKTSSFLAYATPKIKRSFKILLSIRPSITSERVDDGIIWYSAQTTDGTGNFVALVVRNEKIEFIFNSGQGNPGITRLRSQYRLIAGEFAEVFASIDAKEAKLFVNNEAAVSEFYNLDRVVDRESLSHDDLILKTYQYLGGYDERNIKLPQILNGMAGFHGCIKEAQVGNVQLISSMGVLSSFVTSANVNDCYKLFGNQCESLPCQNGGICRTYQKGYKCECMLGFSGYNCEVESDICESLKPCQNNGTCVKLPNEYRCDCAVGFAGITCEKAVEMSTNASFNGYAYLELRSDLLPHDQSVEKIHVVFSTTQSDGILLYQSTNERSSSEYYFAIAVNDGYAVADYKTAKGSTLLKATDHRVNDGAIHYVIVKKTNSECQLDLDGKSVDLATVGDFTGAIQWDNIFLGGMPNSNSVSNEMKGNFNGCIQSLRIQDMEKPIDIGKMAVHMVNVASCPKYAE